MPTSTRSSEPISLFVQPADDLLPSPAATMITGITPQRALAEGVNEAAAFARIFEEMARPETCTLGYNSLRFDDEFVRCGFFRNFYDPYEREWRGGNSRWDLLDVLRLAYALRPEGIAWPLREDGGVSLPPRTSRQRERRARRRGARGAVGRARVARHWRANSSKRSRNSGITRCACATSATSRSSSIRSACSRCCTSRNASRPRA